MPQPICSRILIIGLSVLATVPAFASDLTLEMIADARELVTEIPGETSLDGGARQRMAAHNGKLYVLSLVVAGQDPSRLFCYDPRADSLELILTLAPTMLSLQPLGSDLFISRYSTATGGELWRYDGVRATKILLLPELLWRYAILSMAEFDGYLWLCTAPGEGLQGKVFRYSPQEGFFDASAPPHDRYTSLTRWNGALYAAGDNAYGYNLRLYRLTNSQTLDWQEIAHWEAFGEGQVAGTEGGCLYVHYVQSAGGPSYRVWRSSDGTDFQPIHSNDVDSKQPRDAMPYQDRMFLFGSDWAATGSGSDAVSDNCTLSPESLDIGFSLHDIERIGPIVFVLGSATGTTTPTRLWKIEPAVPELRLSATRLDFPAVTVGDTVALELSISNVGRGILSISRIVLPSSEMRLSAWPPFQLDEGASEDLTIYLEPMRTVGASGDLLIESNDQLSTIGPVDVTSDVRPLSVSSQLLTPVQEVDLGRALTVVVSPARQARVEVGHLFYELLDDLGQRMSVPLSPVLDSFAAVIPSNHVTEAGLRYYVEAENSGIIARDPAGAPEDSFYVVLVRPPVAVSSDPQPNSGSRFLQGREILVRVELEEGTVFQSGSLYFRPAGIADYQQTNLRRDGAVVAVIPDSAVGPRGVQYWVEVNSLTRILTDPADSPRENPHDIPITVQDLREEEVAAAGRYRMVSVPLDFGEDFTGTLESILADQDAFGPYDPLGWRSFRYSPGLRRYLELNEEDHLAEHHLRPGRGYWLVSSVGGQISTSPVTGASTPAQGPFPIELSPGWNQVGNPFVFPVAWSSALVDGQPVGEQSGVEPPVRWNASQRGYEVQVEILRAFEGYWVKNLSDSPLVLELPPIEPDGDGQQPLLADGPRRYGEDESAWIMQIAASSTRSQDRDNFVGVMRDASSEWDRYDRSEPPIGPQESISLYFPRETWTRHPGSYTIDIRGSVRDVSADDRDAAARSPGDPGHVWSFDVIGAVPSPAAAEVLLEFIGIAGAPRESALLLVDRARDNLLDLRGQNHYSFRLDGRTPAGPAETARFLLLVGSEEFIDEHGDLLPEPPVQTVLFPCYPNPFNPSTTIPFQTARSGAVALAIYDSRGSLVRVLLRGYENPARFKIVWDGRDEHGTRVASGVYHCRLTSPGYVESKKMLLIR